MNILIDTNIILDVILQREPWLAALSGSLRMVREPMVYRFASNCMIDIHYHTENVFDSCSLFEGLTNGLVRQTGRNEQALWDWDVVLQAARQQPQPQAK
jgi:hypothetical protein